jgi:uncharacterized membrane protein
MTERFGIPDHAPQHAPDHALQNPTPSGGGMGGWDTGSDSLPSGGGNSGGYGGGGGYYGGGAYVRPKRSLIVAVILASLLGPLGLFYVNILTGIAALFILPPVVRFIAFSVAIAVGGNMDTVFKVAVPTLWIIAIPWAIIGVKVRNWRIDKKEK